MRTIYGPAKTVLERGQHVVVGGNAGTDSRGFDGGRVVGNGGRAERATDRTLCHGPASLRPPAARDPFHSRARVAHPHPRNYRLPTLELGE